MKSILLPVERHPSIEAAMETAVLLARGFDSYIEGFALAPDLPLMAPADAFSGTMVTADPAFQMSDQEREACRSLFTERMQTRGLAPYSGPAEGACFGWYEGSEETTGRGFLGSYGRVFDVTVVERPETGADGTRMAALETALFESGRPVLIAPPEAPAALGANIMIAWNGTPEAARTVAFASSLLRRADQVAVVTIEGGQTPDPSGDQLAWHLRRNGISCEVREVTAPTEGRGGAFLAEAARLGCDLVIKGAYTQSRLRQMIFGGATRHIVTETTLPVFMAH